METICDVIIFQLHVNIPHEQDLFLFKIDFDFTIRNTLRYLFHQKARRFGQTNLYHDWAFIEFETKEITTLHLRWYGDEYKDMPISIDLVPSIKFDDFKPAKPASYWGIVDKCDYYAFCIKAKERW